MKDVLNAPSFICIKKVSERTGLGKKTILAWEAKSKFPRAIRLSPTKRVWYEPDIHEWMLARRAESLALFQEAA